MTVQRSRGIQVYMMDLLATVPYYTAYLSRALLAAGVDVRVGSITYYLDQNCFKTRGLKLQPGCLDVVGRFAKLPRTVRRAAKLAETCANMLALALRFLVSPPQVLHVQYLPMLQSRLPLDAWLMRLAQRRGSRVVLTVHDVLPHDSADRYLATFKRLYGEVDALICHSEHIRQRLQQEFAVLPARIHVIPHGPFFYDLPVRSESLNQASGPVVLWQGIIFPYKGLDLLLAAWKQVEEQNPVAVLRVVGTGSAEILDATRRQVKELGLHRVQLDLRFVSAEELAQQYREAAVVVYPYRAITTSGALATGLALGKAMVVSNLPVFREQLTDGEDALLVPVGDVDALAAGVLRLLRDEPLRDRLCAAVARKDFGARSWSHIAQQTQAVYAETLGHDIVDPAAREEERER